MNKWINSTENCEAYSSFKRLSPDHKIILAKISLCLHRNKKQPVKASQYDWSSLADRDIRNQYIVTVKNKV